MECLNPICDVFEGLTHGGQILSHSPYFLTTGQWWKSGFFINDTPILYERNEKKLADLTILLLRSSKIDGTYQNSLFFWIFWIFLSFKSFYCILFYYILRSPKTPRLIRVKMFRLCSQEDNGAISKIKKKLNK